jgi:hypothetical protein
MLKFILYEFKNLSEINDLSKDKRVSHAMKANCFVEYGSINFKNKLGHG